MPAKPVAIKPSVPGSGVTTGGGVPAVNVPPTNWKLPGEPMKLKLQPPPPGSVRFNCLNVSPSPTNPLTDPFREPEKSKMQQLRSMLL